MKCLAKVVLILVFVAAAGFGQSVAELLEKGIYTQETVGNLDGAIQIYRQILKSAPKDPAHALQAQYRLTECLLAKGDLKGAVQEFGNLARNYPDSKELVMALAKRLQAAGAQCAMDEEYGWFKDGRYHNNWTGMEIVLPSDWALVSQGRSSGAGQIALLDDLTGKVQFAAVWMRKEAIPEADKPKRLEWEISAKSQQRYWADFKDYRIRPESVEIQDDRRESCRQRRCGLRRDVGREGSDRADDRISGLDLWSEHLCPILRADRPPQLARPSKSARRDHRDSTHSLSGRCRVTAHQNWERQSRPGGVARGAFRGCRSARAHRLRSLVHEPGRERPGRIGCAALGTPLPLRVMKLSPQRMDKRGSSSPPRSIRI